MSFLRKPEEDVEIELVKVPDEDKWSGGGKGSGLRGFPSYIQGILTHEQMEAYQMVFRIEEISKILRSSSVLKVPKSRKPAPPPKYDQTGKRINTPEFLYKRQLEAERIFLVENAIRSIPGYVPPTDYKLQNTKLVEKLFIPVKEYPDINFMGLLLGPRGNTLRRLQEESGAKIALRGAGSVKEGKNRNTINERQNNLEEALHCLITSDDPNKVKKGVEACKDVINKAVLTPEGQNDLKRGQLRELAAINGTLREYQERPCPRCGEVGHKRFECPTQKQFIETVVCRICGNMGHFAKDCKMKEGSNGSFNVADQEFAQMMQEINGDGVSSFSGSTEEPPQKRRHVQDEYVRNGDNNYNDSHNNSYGNSHNNSYNHNRYSGSHNNHSYNSNQYNSYNNNNNHRSYDNNRNNYNGANNGAPRSYQTPVGIPGIAKNFSEPPPPSPPPAGIDSSSFLPPPPPPGAPDSDDLPPPPTPFDDQLLPPPPPPPDY